MERDQQIMDENKPAVITCRETRERREELLS